MKLCELGWNNFFEKQIQQRDPLELGIARVLSDSTRFYLLDGEQGERKGELSGRLRFNAQSALDLPVAGDWILYEDRGDGQAIVHEVLARQTCFVRKAAGTHTAAQALGANIDTVFIVCALNADFSVRRIERYLALAWESGARPVVVLTKSDLCSDPTQSQALKATVEAAAPGVTVHAISAMSGEGLGELTGYLAAGSTLVCLGSSGVGKSTLINALVGSSIQCVQQSRAGDDKGRHTTTRRQLVRTVQGAWLLDTPGLREVQLTDAQDGLEQTFADIERLAGHCRFRDCTHGSEPGCAVAQAIEGGTLEAGRLKSYLKMQREIRYLEMPTRGWQVGEQKRKRKTQSKAMKKTCQVS